MYFINCNGNGLEPYDIFCTGEMITQDRSFFFYHFLRPILEGLFFCFVLKKVFMHLVFM